MAHTFMLSDLTREEPDVWRVWLGPVSGHTGTVLFDGTAEELLAELNGRQRAVYGNALEGRLISLGGLRIDP